MTNPEQRSLFAPQAQAQGHDDDELISIAPGVVVRYGGIRLFNDLSDAGARFGFDDDDRVVIVRRGTRPISRRDARAKSYGHDFTEYLRLWDSCGIESTTPARSESERPEVIEA